MKVKDSFSTTLSSKGQITFPVEIRRLFNLKEKDSVEFSISYDDIVTVQPKRLTLKDSFGAVKKKVNKSFSEMREIAREERLHKYK